MEDEVDTGPAPESDDSRAEPAKKSRKAAPAETAETFMANIVTLKGIQVDTKTKAPRGKEMRIPLWRARQWVAKGLVAWADPRPDL